MMSTLVTKFTTIVFTLVAVCVASATAYGQATIVINNNDPANVGFNDPTPVAPVGGNSGTTVGQQRRIAFQFAANIWGQTLNSGPTITVSATWPDTLQCTSTTGVLASAGAAFVARDFPGSAPGTWYGTALANALRSSDQNNNPEITARFNVKIGSSGCFEGRQWYYGLDNNHGIGFNFVSVVLHELSHGLGFQTFTNRTTGVQLGDDQSGRFPTIYDRFLLDNTTGKTWPQMTNEERVASAINTGGLVWNGPRVISDAAQALSIGKDTSGRPFMFAPNPLEGGSSVSHWDRSAAPNQLMEPNINNDLIHSVTLPRDLTFSLMVDIGWCPNCPPPTPSPSPSPPPNDNFALAQPISGCSGSVNGTNVGATREAAEPSHDPASNSGAASVWYQWQAPATSSVTITTAGSNFDTILGVYTGTTVSNLTVIAQNDDVELGQIRTSTVTFSAIGGTVYMIAVDGWGGETGSIVLNWNVSDCVDPAALISIENSIYVVIEGAGGIAVNIWATHQVTNATIEYATGDTAGVAGCSMVSGKASSRCDYIQTMGRLHFTSGGAKTIRIPLIDDTYVEGNEEFTITIRNPTGAGLGPTTSATIRIEDNDSGPSGPTPLGEAGFFVRQHYIDFLNREPDSPGLNFWKNEIESCGADQHCITVKQINVSAAFYLSIEFQQTGYLVYRIYKAAYGNMENAPVPLTLTEFLADTQEIGRGVVVGSSEWEQQLHGNKNVFTGEFVKRSQFTQAHATTMTAGAFVDKLFLNAGVTPSAADRQAAIAEFPGGEAGPSADLAARGRALRRVAENSILEQQELNRAFVLMQYFGYLRRNPNEFPDGNFGGYNFWLDKLIQFNGNFVDAEMVKAFILAGEYRERFGP